MALAGDPPTNQGCSKVKIIFFKKKQINLGEQNVTEWTLLEYKKWFSIKLFHFHKSDGCQDRFHTHAFGAVSILLKGNYTEEVLEGSQIVSKSRNTSRLTYIPRDTYHRITRSTGCYTMLITGPWSGNFKELRQSTGDTYQEWECGEGRADLRRTGEWRLLKHKEENEE